MGSIIKLYAQLTFLRSVLSVSSSTLEILFSERENSVAVIRTRVGWVKKPELLG